MRIPALLDALAAKGIELRVEGDRLRFRAPRGVLSAEQRGALGEQREEVVAELRARAATSTLHAPLSYTQRSLWFVHQAAPGSAAYNVAFAARVTSSIDPAALRTGIQALVDRHAVLRTTYEVVDGTPQQRIAGAVAAALDRHEASGEDDATLRTRIERDYQRPFDLAQGPVIRASLYTRGPQDHVLLLTAHHIAVDAWSLLLLLEELRALYAEATGGDAASLPLPSLTYADCVKSQEAMLEGPEGKRLEAYWLRKLARPRAQIELTGDRPRPAQKSVRGSSLEFKVDSDLSQGLKRLARDEGTTLFVVLLAAFKALLFRYTGTEDVVVGTPTFGRGKPELARIVGHFVNPLPLRTQVLPAESFRELLGRVRQTLLEAVEAQEYPLVLIVERLQPERDPSRSPLFDSLFVLQRFDQFREFEDLFAADRPSASVDFGGLRLQPFPLQQQEGQFDLALELVDAPKALLGAFKFSTDLFDRATIERLAGHFQQLLAAVVADPTRRLSQLALLTAGERRQILLEWNQTNRAYPLDRCLHELIEAQVERTPDRVAVQAQGGSLTYRALEARANQLSHFLRRLGVGPGTLVGIAMERSVEMVVGLLGILKAGGAYVPLDPAYPKDRLAFMMDDSRVPVLLTQDRLRASLPAHGARLVALDTDWEAIARESTARAESAITSGGLAYVIYTSGSTGKPKGAMNAHRGIVNRLLWMQDEYGLAEDDVVLQKTPFSFDVSVWEFFWPLLTGARLVMAQGGEYKDSAYLVRTIVEQGITTVHFVPSMLRVFLEEQGVEACVSLRRVICSGEALPAELRDRFFERLGCELHNLYGPTEAAVDVTSWACRRGERSRTVPIGRPVANTQIYVLDAGLEPVPVGVVGELHIGGVQVGLGYLRRPELTAERFITDPFGEAGARLYKTGDLARFLPDGSVEYLGRIDHQVKVRGFRIELGEIESALEQHPGVRQAVVVAHTYGPGDIRLVGYVVAEAKGAPSVDDLRRELRAKLPEYMIPAQFVSLDALPLSPSGKVDRTALRAPEADRQTEERFVEPRNDAERRLAAIWTELLGIDRIGIHDNFFELGGHSLLATRVLARIDDSFGVRLALRDVFDAPTIHGLSERIAADALGDSGAARSPDDDREEIEI